MTYLSIQGSPFSGVREDSDELHKYEEEKKQLDNGKF